MVENQNFSAGSRFKERLGRRGQLSEAIALYQSAQKLDPQIDLNPNTDAIEKDPEAVARSLAALAKVEEGRRLAREGKFEDAIAVYQEVQKLNPQIDLNPSTEAIKQDPEAVVKVWEGRRLAREGKVPEAIALFQSAQKLDPQIDLNPFTPFTEAIEKDPEAVARLLFYRIDYR